MNISYVVNVLRIIMAVPPTDEPTPDLGINSYLQDFNCRAKVAPSRSCNMPDGRQSSASSPFSCVKMHLDASICIKIICIKMSPRPNRVPTGSYRVLLICIKMSLRPNRVVPLHTTYNVGSNMPAILETMLGLTRRQSNSLARS